MDLEAFYRSNDVELSSRMDLDILTDRLRLPSGGDRGSGHLYWCLGHGPKTIHQEAGSKESRYKLASERSGDPQLLVEERERCYTR